MSDLTIEIKVSASGIEYGGDVENPKGDITAAAGQRLRFWCLRPFAFFIKNSASSPFDDDEYVYGAKWIKADERWETPHKLKGTLIKGKKYYYCVAALTTGGTIVSDDPRILIG